MIRFSVFTFLLMTSIVFAADGGEAPRIIHGTETRVTEFGVCHNPEEDYGPCFDLPVEDRPGVTVVDGRTIILTAPAPATATPTEEGAGAAASTAKAPKKK